MKKFAITTLLAAGLAISANASAFWDNDNYECWGNPYDCNPYDPWDPRYWFEEMENVFDDDDYGHPMPYGYAPGYQAVPGQMPYQMPYMPPRPPYYGPHAPRPGMVPAPVAPKQPAAPQKAPEVAVPQAAQAK